MPCGREELHLQAPAGTAQPASRRGPQENGRRAAQDPALQPAPDALPAGNDDHSRVVFARIPWETAAHAGAYLLTLWGLPPEVVEAVACLSGPFEARPDRQLDLVSVVQVAHVLVESEHIGSCGWAGGPVPDRAWLEAAGVFDEVSAWKAERRDRVS